MPLDDQTTGGYMPDCEHPKCHEQFTKELAMKASWKRVDELAKATDAKVPKSWVWLGFVVIGLPFIVMAAGVWSGQTSDPLRYADKTELIDCRMRIDRLEESSRYFRRDLDEIKLNVNEVLRIVRKVNGITTAPEHP